MDTLKEFRLTVAYTDDEVIVSGIKGITPTQISAVIQIMYHLLEEIRGDVEE